MSARFVGAVPTTSAAAGATPSKEVSREHKEASAGVKIAVLAVRYCLGMDGEDACAIGMVAEVVTHESIVSML
jgi:hypothetical protein